MLNSSVPANWTIAACQSAPASRGVAASCSAAALVKKIEPTKNTMPSAVDPTSCRKPGKGPTRKHSEPIANSAPITRGERKRPLSVAGARLDPLAVDLVQPAFALECVARLGDVRRQRVGQPAA